MSSYDALVARSVQESRRIAAHLVGSPRSRLRVPERLANIGGGRSGRSATSGMKWMRCVCAASKLISVHVSRKVWLYAWSWMATRSRPMSSAKRTSPEMFSMSVASGVTERPTGEESRSQSSRAPPLAMIRRARTQFRTLRTTPRVRRALGGRAHRVAISRIPLRSATIEHPLSIHSTRYPTCGRPTATGRRPGAPSRTGE
jgi:hypothetical protein